MSTVTAGRPAPLGATPTDGGVNFALFSEHATRVTLCLFDDRGRETRIDLPECDGHIWHGHVLGIGPGQLYGYRVHGPYRPEDGHRFNANKLLLDPYARHITGHPRLHDELMGYEVGAVEADLSFDTRDSARHMPKCMVEDLRMPPAKRPGTPLRETVIYEAHVKGMTRLHPEVREKGTFRGLASEPMLDHLTKLGITAIELLPVQAFLTDKFLVERGLTNYWGYQTVGFFAPDPRYLSRGRIAEFRQMVDRFHGAGIEVILDVVYNHTGEGNELGPTLSFRGIDNASYYRLAPEPRFYVNDTGTGNTLNIAHPMVLRMVMDSLRYWVEVMGVDGFRFDLCATLGRNGHGFDRDGAFFTAIRQDPVLSRVKLIAEPWDIGPGGYQLGAFPPPFLEWNDRYRDGVRRFWRGDPGRAPDLAARITGSATEFDHSGRSATSSVNFLTAHDGMTLEDLVSYDRKHNEANGEEGRDGHAEDFSDNMGAEGPTDDAAIRAARARRKRAMMATLLLSQGTPMILAGDEIGNTQGGNNNAYNQDNATSWIDWSQVDHAFLDFTRRMIAFRQAHPILGQRLFLHARERVTDGVEDLFWWRADGKPMQTRDWDDPAIDFLAAEMRTASGTPHYAAAEYAIFVAFNAGRPRAVRLPAPPEGRVWSHQIDTAEPLMRARRVTAGRLEMAGQSVTVCVLVPEV
ncbi:glycogen debranching protein GlgX [Palleronia sp. KMU-117]|uniref:glycogen debranching protein GlgX n=1 Tax=Palleronia sp. KMU-117 TaxID=3434108 RepID=UPI003D73DAF5